MVGIAGTAIMTKPITIFASDLHFSHTVPVARSAEPDWYDAQARPLLEMLELQELHDVPIILAGDIFDRWNSVPELINFLINTIPPGREIYAVPGQHELPNHNYQEIHRSAYWTLVQAGVLKDLYPGRTEITSNNLRLHGFPWGFPPEPPEAVYKDEINIAVIHAYVWNSPENSYPGAPPEKVVSKYRSVLEAYSAAVFGDNHKGFIFGNSRCINCGTFMRRKQDEREYKPMLGILHDDLKIRPHYLDTSEDKWVEPDEKTIDEAFDPTKFIEELKSMGSDSLDFREALRQYLDRENATSEVRALVENSLFD